MIQRVQTIWMIITAAAVFLTFTLTFPFYSGTLVADNLYHPIIATENLYLIILTSALGTGVLINIFLFKQRSIQFRIIIFALLDEALIIFLYVKQIALFSKGSFGIGTALHILIIIALIFAARGIYKDSKLIKESNRLR
jgi:Domain of unknown function (DUF4293)